MTNPIMSEEQWAALVEMFDAGDYAEWVAARDKARRLLVADPEQPKHNGPCVGGPLDGILMAMDDEIVQVQGGEYQWSGFEQNWEWVADVDPDLTTFGDLKARGWFELTAPGWPENDRIRLLVEDRVVYDCGGIKRMVENHQPVRRLPKPEWPQ